MGQPSLEDELAALAPEVPPGLLGDAVHEDLDVALNAYG
jgi:hypothetical protein